MFEIFRKPNGGHGNEKNNSFCGRIIFNPDAFRTAASKN